MKKIWIVVFLAAFVLFYTSTKIIPSESGAEFAQELAQKDRAIVTSEQGVDGAGKKYTSDVERWRDTSGRSELSPLIQWVLRTAMGKSKRDRETLNTASLDWTIGEAQRNLADVALMYEINRVDVKDLSQGYINRVYKDESSLSSVTEDSIKQYMHPIVSSIIKNLIIKTQEVFERVKQGAQVGLDASHDDWARHKPEWHEWAVDAAFIGAGVASGAVLKKKGYSKKVIAPVMLAIAIPTTYRLLNKYMRLSQAQRGQRRIESKKAEIMAKKLTYDQAEIDFYEHILMDRFIDYITVTLQQEDKSEKKEKDTEKTLFQKIYSWFGR